MSLAHASWQGDATDLGAAADSPVVAKIRKRFECHRLLGLCARPRIDRTQRNLVTLRSERWNASGVKNNYGRKGMAGKTIMGALRAGL